jgi:hypothetical protein
MTRQIKRTIGASLFTLGTMAVLFLSGGRAEASTGLYGHCMDAPPVGQQGKPCVDTTGWGINLRFEDGSHSDNYGPESYTATMVDGKLYYQIHGEPYGDPVFPNFDY